MKQKEIKIAYSKKLRAILIIIFQKLQGLVLGLMKSIDAKGINLLNLAVFQILISSGFSYLAANAEIQPLGFQIRVG